MTLEERYDSIEGHGSLLTLFASPSAGLAPNAIGDALKKFIDQPKPYVGLIVSIEDEAYRFTSIDIGAVVMACVDHEKRRSVPCVLVDSGKRRRELERVLKITKLEWMIRILETESQARDAIQGQLDGGEAV